MSAAVTASERPASTRSSSRVLHAICVICNPAFRDDSRTSAPHDVTCLCGHVVLKGRPRPASPNITCVVCLDLTLTHACVKINRGEQE